MSLLIFGLRDLDLFVVWLFIGLFTEWLLAGLLLLEREWDLDFDLDLVLRPLLLLLCFDVVLVTLILLSFLLLIIGFSSTFYPLLLSRCFDGSDLCSSLIVLIAGGSYLSCLPILASLCLIMSLYEVVSTWISLASKKDFKCLFSAARASLSFLRD